MKFVQTVAAVERAATAIANEAIVLKGSLRQEVHYDPERTTPP
jgi:hypothetical protein